MSENYLEDCGLDARYWDCIEAAEFEVIGGPVYE